MNMRYNLVIASPATMCVMLGTCFVVLSTAGGASAGTLSDDARGRIARSGVVASEVISAVEATDTVRVGVVFDTGAVASALTDGFDKAVWDAAVKNVGDEVIQRLATDEFTLAYRFRSVRGFVGSVNSSGLLKLAEDSNVLRVDVDQIAHASLVDAVPFTGLRSAQNLGFTGDGVTVAVLDTGVDRSHPDLSDDIIDEQCFCGDPGSGCCPNGSNAQGGVGSAHDGDGHGTYVSGIITGRGSVAARGGSPDAGILAVKVLDDNGSGTTSGIVAGLDWIYNNRPDVDVVNMSLGGSFTIFDVDCDDANAFGMMYRDAINNLRVIKVPVFAASGNDGAVGFMNMPACVRNAISVGASYDNDPNVPAFPSCDFPSPRADAVACFSNSNSHTDLLAPGVFITSAAAGGSSVTHSGTSAATPLASACAAVLLQAVPSLTAFQIETALKNAPRIHDERSDSVFPPAGLDYPRLDCFDALMQVLSGSGLCPPAPRGGCKRPPLPKAGKLQLSNGPSDDRDSMAWFWYKGAATSLSEYGNPLVSTSFSLCMYRPASPRLILNLFAPAGGECGSKPCWTSLPFGAGRFKYKDSLLSPSGIRELDLRPGAPGKTKIRMAGKGANLRLPATPLVGTSLVQWINHSNNVCWEATYSRPTRNDAFRFAAQSD